MLGFGLVVGLLLGFVLASSSYKSPPAQEGPVHYDYSRDGTNDAVLHYKQGLVDGAWEDRNLDGDPDIWHAYEEGVITRSQGDENFNGTIDAWYYYSNGLLAKMEMDRNEDDLIELMETYQFGQLIRQEWYTSATSLYRKVFFDRGVKTQEVIDTDSDGTIDTKILFDDFEKPVQTTKIDVEDF